MERIISVDLFRLIAIIAVISLHTKPFDANPNENFEIIEICINQFARFAVPFFFVISGYFWGAKLRNGTQPLLLTKIYIKRLSFLFFSWSIIYLLPTNLGAIYQHGILGPIKVVYWNFNELISHPLRLMLEGINIEKI